MNNMVEVGDTVRDVITGFTGIVKVVVRWHHACNRIIVQPRDLEDKKANYVQATHTFDEPEIEILQKKTIVLSVTPETTNLKIGDLVKDTYTPFQGKIAGFAEYLNGCLRVAVQSPTLKDGKVVEEELFPASQLELVQEEVNPPVKKTTGGPMPDPKGPRDPMC